MPEAGMGKTSLCEGAAPSKHLLCLGELQPGHHPQSLPDPWCDGQAFREVGHMGQVTRAVLGCTSQTSSPPGCFLGQGGNSSNSSPCLVFLGKKHMLLHPQEELVYLWVKVQGESGKVLLAPQVRCLVYVPGDVCGGGCGCCPLVRGSSGWLIMLLKHCKAQNYR